MRELWIIGIGFYTELYLFSKECIALTWDEGGVCRGVRMVRHGDRYSIIAHWQGACGFEDELSSVLSRGIRELGGDDTTPLVVGSVGGEFGFIDLSMPDLDSDNLRNALRFELNKQAPVKSDQLVWGFRVIGVENSKRQLVRLVYIPKTRWEDLMDRLGGLGWKLDAIIPAPAALDPILADTPLFIEDGGGTGADCLYMPGRQGRELLYPAPDSVREPAWGAGDDPLALEGLEIGGLADLSAAEQRPFAGAAVLGMYGTSSCLRTDRKNWLPLPEVMRPRRHQFGRRTAAMLGIYIGFILLFSLGRGYVEGVRYLDELQSREDEIRRRIDQLSNGRGTQQFVSALREDLVELNLNRPTLLQCLIDLTENIPDEYWVSNFNWRDGEIELQIQSEHDDLTFLERLRESPLLTDVLPIRKTVDHENNVTFQVRMRVAVENQLEGATLGDISLEAP